MSLFQEHRIATVAMNSQPWEFHQVELYERIQALKIDQAGVSLPFSKRLARDHQWSLVYTQRVIEEYKKFLFLTIVAGHPVTPSEAIDAAWHLHLTYTHSYWDDLCTQILQKPLHHHPTQGGEQQRSLFRHCYSQTLDSYAHFFGDCAPADIWPALEARFQQAGQFRQVSSQDYWLIRKPKFALPGPGALNIGKRSWLQVVTIACLTFGLILSLDSLYHPAIASFLDWINPTAIAQVSPPPAPSLDGSKPSTPEGQPPQDWWWLFCIMLVLGMIKAWLDSWCPHCWRFWRVKTTTRTLQERTEQIDGVTLITRSCNCCSYTAERYERIPAGSDSDPNGCCACM
jgi:hypothetical protein